MAEAHGLALDAAALFKACMEGFDIVVTSEGISEDKEQLCALFSLQRVRFGLWGESVGLVPSPHDGRRLRYDKHLDRDDIKTQVNQFLSLTKSLLEEAGRVDLDSGLKWVPEGSKLATSRGLDIFKASFERFKLRIRKQQKGTATWAVTRCAIQDAQKFEYQIGRLKDYVDGLESLTKSLGLLEQQHARLHEEIESISDTQSLRLLRDASSRRSSSQQVVSDTASQRLIEIVGSYVERQSGETIFTRSVLTSTTASASFVTARTRPSEITDISFERRISLRAGSVTTEMGTQRSRPAPPLRIPKEKAKPTVSCTECLEEHYKCISNSFNLSCTRCLQKDRVCSFVINTAQNEVEATMNSLRLDQNEKAEKFPLDAAEINDLNMALPTEIPQNQRLLSDLLGKAKPRAALSFEMGDVHYGEHLKKTKEEDSDRWISNSGKIIAHANSGSSAAKRMFLELRDIRAGKVPFISATPIDDNLDRVLASIEGPPETPYEGGIFWITVKLSVADPYGPPLMRFHTKIYHPNISPQGHICADYRDKWNAVLSAGFSPIPVKDPSAAWFSGNSKQVKWSLGALLTALCGLLASPDVEDPLVPEIAMKYLEDYEDYCRSARLSTQKWATGPRPNETELLFLEEDFSEGLESWRPNLNSQERPPSVDVVSIQESLRRIYDDKALEGITILDHDDAAHMIRKSYTSRIQEQSPLASRVSFEQVEAQWYRFLDSQNKNLRSDQIEDITGDSLVSDLSELIQFSREYLTIKNVRHDDISDVSIWYSLLELAASASKKTFRESTQFGFNRLIQVCTAPFLNACERYKVEVSEATSPNFYEISISDVLAIPDQVEWIIVRSWDDIRQLNLDLSEYIPGGELWQLGFPSHQANWICNLPHETVPNGGVMGPLLAFALRMLLLFHGPKFLEISSSSKVLAFFRPSGPFDGVTLRRDEPSTLGRVMRMEALTSINVRAFIPPRLFGLMKVTRLIGYQYPVSIRLIDRGMSHFYLALCSISNEHRGQNFNVYDVKAITSSDYSKTQTHQPQSHLLSFSMDGAEHFYTPNKAQFQLLFSNRTEFMLWSEVLKLFQRLAPYSPGIDQQLPLPHATSSLGGDTYNNVDWDGSWI